MLKKVFFVVLTVFFLIKANAQNIVFKRIIEKHIQANNLGSSDTAFIKGVYFENGQGKYYGKVWLFFLKNGHPSFQYINYETDSKRKYPKVLIDTLIKDLKSAEYFTSFIRKDLIKLENEFKSIDSLIGVKCVQDGATYFMRDIQNGKKFYIGLFINNLTNGFDTPFYETSKIIKNTKYISHLIQAMDLIIFETFE